VCLHGVAVVGWLTVRGVVGVGFIAGGFLGWCQRLGWERCSGCHSGDY
jgi:hypothetical protein